MVTKDTVDEDIYAMQQRKSEMNAAIMENRKNFKSAAEKEAVLNSAVDRFLHTPSSATREKKEQKGIAETSDGETTTSITSPAAVAHVPAKIDDRSGKENVRKARLP